MILYSVVARAKDGIILVESIVSGVEGNHPQITVELLERIVSTFQPTLSDSKKSKSSTNPPSNLPANGNESFSAELLPEGERRTFVQRHDQPLFGGFFAAAATAVENIGCPGSPADNDEENKNNVESQERGDLDYYFHLVREKSIICLCISDDTDIRQHAVNYNFLDDVKDKFVSLHSSHRIAKARAYEMDKSFRIEFGKLVHFYNENRRSMGKQENVGQLLSRVEDLKQVLGRNIVVVLQREARLNELVEQSDEMLMNTKVFSKRSTALKGRVQRKNALIYICVAVFVFFVIYLFAAQACGPTLSNCGS